jgi:hypothetical protein
MSGKRPRNKGNSTGNNTRNSKSSRLTNNNNNNDYDNNLRNLFGNNEWENNSNNGTGHSSVGNNDNNLSSISNNKGNNSNNGTGHPIIKRNNVEKLRIRISAPTIKNGRSKVWIPGEDYWAHPNSPAALKLGIPTPRNTGTPYPNFHFNSQLPTPVEKEKKNRKTRKARKNRRSY